MPPLLVLATTERQAEWWNQASEQVAARLHVDRPLGAVACVLSAEAELTNGWRLPWRTLGTNEPCHLRDLACPLRAPAVPEPLGMGGAATARRTSEHLRQREKLELQGALRPSQRSYALAQLTKLTRPRRPGQNLAER